MLPKDSLKDLLSQKLSHGDKLLVCLAVDGQTARPVKEVRQLAVGAGVRAAKNWNVSAILARTPELAARTDAGWELTAKGIDHVTKLAGPLVNSPIPKVASSLRAHLVKVSNADTQAFVEEAITCFESRQYRAAVVLSWVGAVSVLHNHIVAKDLAGFNAEATTRFAGSKTPWVAAKNSDGLARMKESDLLLLLEKRAIIGKNVRQQLEKCLDLRNGCGHPNSLKVADHVVSSHVELLILNVYAVFA